MIYDLGAYFLDEALPRWKSIFCGSELWIALGCGIVIGGWGNSIFIADLRVGDVASALLTYAAIALGFCLSGLIVALTLPDRDFARELATNKTSATVPNSYSNLMFVFSWTAIAHWFVVFVALLALLMLGSDALLYPAHSHWTRHLGIGLVGFIASYALFQFLLAVITLSMVGRLYINSLVKDSEAERK
jgi:hypothetical protein